MGAEGKVTLRGETHCMKEGRLLCAKLWVGSSDPSFPASWLLVKGDE